MTIKRSGDIVLSSTSHNREFLMDMRYVPSEVEKQIILFIHGFKGFKDWGAFDLMADYFAKAGFVFAKMNFSHNGTTIDHPLDFADLKAFGNNNFTLEQGDIGSALDALLDSDFIEDTQAYFKKVYLLGHSRGGAAAILKAVSDNRISKLATLAALNDLASRYPQHLMDQWEVDGVLHIYNGRTEQQMPLYHQIVEDYHTNESQLNVKDAIERLNKPYIAIHGTSDETLPISMLHEIKIWNDTVEIVEIDGANHTFGSTHPYMQNELPKDMKIAVDHIIAYFEK
jgi:pimeloyl-ACP methyl ester carboxylesterase